MDQCRKPDSTAASPPDVLWTILAGPFTRADRLRAFVTAVRRIEGVTNLVAERFQLGELVLTLRYAGEGSLIGWLAALPDCAAAVEPEGDGALRLVITNTPPDG
jgi:hypothetical protein